jgi:hypothetical protein
MAVTVALGVGVVLARAERGRREERDRDKEHARVKLRKRERRFEPLRGESTGAALRRMALGQLDLAIEALERGAEGASAEERVHEARKALKRLRALVKLARRQLGEDAYERENALLRDTGRRLARARDAAVMLATLEELIDRHERKLAKRGGVQELRSRLRAERAGAAERALAQSALPSGALGELRSLRARVEAWQLPQSSGIKSIEPALEGLYRSGRKRMRRAAKAGPRRRTRRLHEWRKRVKDLRYAQEMLGARRLAKQADELGELLGAEHDLAVLAERVQREAGTEGALGKRTRKLLLKLIAKRRRKLRKRALRDGAQLYGRKRRRFVRRVRKASPLR